MTSTFLRIEPFGLRVNLLKTESDEKHIGRLSYSSSADKLSFDLGCSNGTGEKEENNSVAKYKNMTWDIPAYNPSESWRDYVSSVVVGQNLGFFRFGLASKHLESDVDHILRVLKEINRELEKHPKKEFRFEYGFYGLTDVKVIDLETFKSLPVTNLPALHNFVVNSTNGAENISQIIKNIKEKELRSDLPLLCTIHIQIIEPGVSHIKCSSVCIGSLGSVWLNELCPTSSLDRSMCHLRNFMLLTQQPTSDNLDIPLSPLLYFTHEFFGGSAKTVCIIDVEDTVVSRDQYSSVLMLDVLRKMKNTHRVNFDDSRFFDLDQLEVVENQVKELQLENTKIREKLSATEKIVSRVEEEKDQVYRSVLKEKAAVEYESNAHKVQVVKLKEQIRSKSVEILRFTESLDRITMERDQLKGIKSKSDQSMTEISSLKAQVKELSDSLEKEQDRGDKLEHQLEESQTKCRFVEEQLKSKDVEIQTFYKLNDKNDSVLLSLQSSLKDQMNSMANSFADLKSENRELRSKLHILEEQNQTSIMKRTSSSMTFSSSPGGTSKKRGRPSSNNNKKIVSKQNEDLKDDLEDDFEDEKKDDFEDEKKDDFEDEKKDEDEIIVKSSKKIKKSSKSSSGAGAGRKKENNFNKENDLITPPIPTTNFAAKMMGKNTASNGKISNSNMSSVSSKLTATTTTTPSSLFAPSLLFGGGAKGISVTGSLALGESNNVGGSGGDLDPERRRIKLPALKKSSALITTGNNMTAATATTTTGKSHINKAVFGSIADGFKVVSSQSSK